MIHLPKKHPWLILVGIYVVIMLVWGAFYFLAKETGDQQLEPDEAAKLLESRKKQDNAQ